MCLSTIDVIKYKDQNPCIPKNTMKLHRQVKVYPKSLQIWGVQLFLARGLP